MTVQFIYKKQGEINIARVKSFYLSTNENLAIIKVNPDFYVSGATQFKKDCDKLNELQGTERTMTFYEVENTMVTA